jgi:hypothetical protein
LIGRRSCSTININSSILVCVSATDSWDLVVPEDDAQLGAEIRRHIAHLKPGQRIRVTIAGEASRTAGSAVAGKAVAGDEVDEADLPFIGSVSGGPRDLASRTDDYLSQGFGR